VVGIHIVAIASDFPLWITVGAQPVVVLEAVGIATLIAPRLVARAALDAGRPFGIVGVGLVIDAIRAGVRRPDEDMTAGSLSRASSAEWRSQASMAQTRSPVSGRTPQASQSASSVSVSAA